MFLWVRIRVTMSRLTRSRNSTVAEIAATRYLHLDQDDDDDDDDAGVGGRDLTGAGAPAP